MTDSAYVYKEVDASKIYSRGQAFQIIARPFGLYGIRLKNKGTVPDVLLADYSSPAKAEVAIKDFIVKRKDHVDFIERKRDVRRSKELHAKKVERQQVVAQES